MHSGGTLWTNGGAAGAFGGVRAPSRSSRDASGGVRDIGFAARAAGESVDKGPTLQVSLHVNAVTPLSTVNN